MPVVRLDHRLRLRQLAAAALCLVSALAQAQHAGVYKWVDAQGRTHYDDSNLTEQRLTLDYLNARRIPAREDATTPREFIAAVTRRCDAVRDRLAGYRSASRLEGRDPSGIRYVLSPRQTQIEIAIGERDMARYCSPGAAERLYREPLPASAGAAKTTPVERR
ncbi:MAG: hypothetical protein NVS9B10_20940 [Nevskia sp.]